MDPRDLGAVGRLLGGVLLLVSAALLLPLVWALASAEPAEPFVVSALIGGVGGGGLLWTLRRTPRGLTHRAAFLGVTGSWIAG